MSQKFTTYLAELYKVIDVKSEDEEIIDLAKANKVDKKEKEDTDREGLLRKVKDAHLIYKRRDTDGTFSELWIYKLGKGVRDEFIVRSAILDGTDIDHKTGQSKDEKQYYELWTCGDRQMMKIYGLTN